MDTYREQDRKFFGSDDCYDRCPHCRAFARIAVRIEIGETIDRPDCRQPIGELELLWSEES